MRSMRVVGSLVLAVSCLTACAPRSDPPAQPPPPYYYAQPQPYPYPQQPQPYYPQPYYPQPYYPQPPPPSQPSPYAGPQDPLARYNVDAINGYRARAGLAPFQYDTQISAFAYAGSQQLSQDHAAHAHFHCCSHGAPGFGRARAENQGDPGGVPQMNGDPLSNGRSQIDTMLRMMMDEGPGGGHYDNMMSARYRRVGVGLFYVGGTLYMTNDFSD
jgi:hypothetical protein